MNAKKAWGIALCLIAPLCIGCAGSNPGVVRGQSPAGPQPNFGARVIERTHHATYDPGMTTHGGPFVPSGMEDCPPDAGHDLSQWQPTHHLWYKYNHPRNLVYPQDNTPAAVVQYPYYTCKGPDDFFRQ
ncbi:MAG: hypothetical protein AB7O26_13410 [Planctomycetaceae bacterium]